MRILSTLVKVILGLAVALPLGIVALVLGLGILGVMLGLAVVALKLALVAFVGYGLFRVARYFFAPAAKPTVRPMRELSAPDPHYEAAMREIDAELGHTATSQSFR